MEMERDCIGRGGVEWWWWWCGGGGGGVLLLGVQTLHGFTGDDERSHEAAE